jgi:uncharacterized protein (DUF305 family)
MRASTIGASVLAMLTVLLVSRCVAAGPAPHSAAGHSPTGEGPAAISTPAGTASGSSFNDTDIAWLQLMIPMTEQAVRLLELAPSRTSTPRITRFAAEAVTDRRTTLRGLRDLLRRASVPESDEHEGHDMPGMVTAADFAALNRTGGAAFDRLFTRDAREYLTQSILVAKGERRSGADQGTKAFAAAMEKAHSDQLARLEP